MAIKLLNETRQKVLLHCDRIENNNRNKFINVTVHQPATNHGRMFFGKCINVQKLATTTIKYTSHSSFTLILVIYNWSLSENFFSLKMI